MNTITLRRVSATGYATHFLTWLVKLPIRFVRLTVEGLYWLLSKVLPARKTALRLIFYQIFILGWVLAAFCWHQQYVVRCSEGGYFVTRPHCDELAQNRTDSQELARVQFVEENADIMK